MARPFALPSEDEAEAQEQQLEQLMLDLYAALQQVLRSRSAQHASRNREYHLLLLNVQTTRIIGILIEILIFQLFFFLFD